MEYPKSVSVKTLRSCSQKKSDNRTKVYQALYSGGSSMTLEIKKKLILKRANEIQFQPKLYDRRLERAYYINRAGGIVDWIISNATQDTPRIIVGENATEDQKQFWLKKNIDVDGYGTPFASFFRQLLKNQLVSRNPYIEIEVADSEINMSSLDPEMVIDWGYDGATEWIKTYAVNYYKETPFEKSTTTEHIWTIYTNTDTVVYKSLSKKEDANEQYVTLEGIYSTDEDQAEAYLDYDSSVFGHDFGALPIIECSKNDDQNWLMDRISQNIIALYNAESDLSWVLSESAYPQSILKLESEARFQTVYNKSESNVWNLLAGEEYGIVSSNGTDFNAQFKNVDRLKLSLHESMQMLSQKASEIPQAGRLSGEAIKEIQTPLQSLLSSYTWPIVDQIYDAIERIKEYRNESDLGVWIVGLNTNPDELALRRILVGDVTEVQEVEEVEENETSDMESDVVDTEETENE